ncbi:hypothetical protein [Mycobacteroides abscessus]|uniref:hypothetical protein n=1 Tax=Mycobacteroides abscessus TaxID=36809 RepID=UPI0018965208
MSTSEYRPATTAAEHPKAWAAAFNSLDPANTDKFNSDDTIFIPEPGYVLKGAGPLRAVMQEFMNLGLPIQENIRRVYESDGMPLSSPTGRSREKPTANTYPYPAPAPTSSGAHQMAAGATSSTTHSEPRRALR